MLRTWENLAEKVNFLLEVSMRELLMGGLHKVLAGVEEILQKKQKRIEGQSATAAGMGNEVNDYLIKSSKYSYPVCTVKHTA